MYIQTLDPNSETDARRCFRAFAYLRPHWVEAEFESRVRKQATEGYLIAYIEAGEEIVAPAGFRVLNFLACPPTKKYA